MIHIRLPDDIIEMISFCIEGKSLNDKVKNYICSTIHQRDQLLNLQKEYELRLERIRYYLSINPLCNLSNLPKDEYEFLKEAKAVIAKNSEFAYGRREVYAQKFNKKLSMAEFRLILDKIKNGDQ